VKIEPVRCPSCFAVVEVPPNMDRATCEYCGTTSLIDLSQGQMTLKMASELSGLRQKVEETNALAAQSALKSSEDTQKELQRLRLNQELATVELRLANAQSEIRSLQRNSGKKNKNYKRDLLSLETQVRSLNAQSVQIQQSLRALDPIDSPVELERAATKQAGGRSILGCLGGGFLWLTLYVILSGLFIQVMGEAGTIVGLIATVAIYIFFRRRRKK